MFDKAVPSRFKVNKPYTFSGRVTLTDRPYHGFQIRVQMADGTQRTQAGAVNGGRFSVTTRFPKRGNWEIRVFLFYPDSGPQFHVTGLTGIIVT